MGINVDKTRVMNKNEAILVLNKDTIYFHRVGEVHAMYAHHGHMSVFIDEYSDLADLELPQLCEALVRIDSKMPIFNPELIEALAYESISNLSVPTDICKMIPSIPNVKWYVLTNDYMPYKPIGDEVVLTANREFDLGMIQNVIEAYSISTIILNDYPLFKILIESLSNITLMIPKCADFFSDNTMTRFKEDEFIQQHELLNRIEIAVYDPFGRFGDDRYVG